MPMMASLTNAGGLPVPRDLPGAIAEAKAALFAHQAHRPASMDIPARTKWAQDKDLLEARLGFLEGSVRVQWTDLEISGRVASQAPVQAPRLNRYAHPRKTPRERLNGALRKQASLVRNIEHAPDAQVCAKVRQQVFSLRHDMKRLCQETGLALPIFAPVPVNPWTQEVAR